MGELDSDLEARLKECNRFGREEEVEIITQGIIAKLKDSQGYTFRFQRGRFNRSPCYQILNPNGESVIEIHTFDSYGGRVVEALFSPEISEAINSVDKIIPRELEVRYWN